MYRIVTGIKIPDIKVVAIGGNTTGSRAIHDYLIRRLTIVDRNIDRAFRHTYSIIWCQVGRKASPAQNCHGTSDRTSLRVGLGYSVGSRRQVVDGAGVAAGGKATADRATVSNQVVRVAAARRHMDGTGILPTTTRGSGQIRPGEIAGAITLYQ